RPPLPAAAAGGHLAPAGVRAWHKFPARGVWREPERCPLRAVGLVGAHTCIKPFSPRTRPVIESVIHDSLQGSTRRGYGAGMVTARSTAWRVAAVRPSALHRDRAVRLPPSVWARLLADAPTVAAYHARVHRRGPGEHWFWLGPISSTGGAKLRIRAAIGGGVIAAPVRGWQLSRGPLPRGRGR